MRVILKQAFPAEFTIARRKNWTLKRFAAANASAVIRMREEFAVYAIESGRICVAALNSKNVDYSADAIAKVIR